ncbi:MAG: glycosyltransferase [Nakamurella sp.]
MNPVDRVAVVIPARNEERRLDQCLRALSAARQELARARPLVAVQVTVVLDRCTDRSAAAVLAHTGVRGVLSSAGMVGAARRLGVRQALAENMIHPDRTWIACTDADSLVPSQWLLRHVEIADRGADLLLGTVIPDPSELSDTAFDEWLELNPQHDGHPYVHGANLGVRATAYLDAGGFPSVSEHEDVLLATAVRAISDRVVSSAGCPVLTSARVHGRTPGGFAGYLAALQHRPGVPVALDRTDLLVAGGGQQ